LQDGLFADASGNVWVADTMNYRVREIVAATGVIDTVAGTGSPGEGIPATTATLGIPEDVATDTAGHLFTADQQNGRVRRVDPATGIITTVAGGGLQFGERIPATEAFLGGPTGVALDRNSNVFFSDGPRVLRLEATSGTLTTIVNRSFSGGFTGDGGPAIDATLSCCFLHLAVDGSGNVLIADSSNNRIRKVDAVTGVISTIAGDGSGGFNGDGIPATSASLNFPSAVAVDSNGSVYIADTTNHRIRRIDVVSGLISTVVGTGSIGFVGSNGDGGPALTARLNNPEGLAFDSLGNLFISEFGGSVRRVDASSGIIVTVAGSQRCCDPTNGDGGAAVAAALNGPRGIAIDGTGDLFITESIGNRIRRVTPSAFLSSSSAALIFDAQVIGGTSPQQVVTVRNTGAVVLNIFGVTTTGDFAVTNECGASVASGASCSVIARFEPTEAGKRVGTLTINNNAFGGPETILLSGVATTPPFAPTIHTEPTSQTVIAPAPGIDMPYAYRTVAGAPAGGSSDGAGSAAGFSLPSGVAVGDAGTVYVADSNNNTIRALTAEGVVSTLAGTAIAGFCGGSTDGMSSAARF